MVQIDQDLQALADDVIRLSALDIRNEANAAGVMLVPGIIKTLRFGQSHIFRSSMLCRGQYP
jgi:hypothetical protein